MKTIKISYFIILLALSISCSHAPQKVEAIDVVKRSLGNPTGERNYKMLDFADVSASENCKRYAANILIDSTLSDTAIDRNFKLAIIDMFEINGDGKAYAVRAFNKESDKLAFITCDYAPFGDWSSCCLHDYSLDQFAIKIWR